MQSGDTLSSIAAKFGVIVAGTGRCQQANQPLDPAYRPGVGDSCGRRRGRSPHRRTRPAGAGTKYTVKSGDSPVEHRDPVRHHLAGTGGRERPDRASRLSIGQELVIPGKGGAPQAASTPPPAADRRPAPPAPTAVALLPAPRIVDPGDQASYGGGAHRNLSELASRWMRCRRGPGTASRSSGPSRALPMEYLVPVTTATSIRMPSWLFERADQPARQVHLVGPSGAADDRRAGQGEGSPVEPVERNARACIGTRSTRVDSL